MQPLVAPICPKCGKAGPLLIESLPEYAITDPYREHPPIGTTCVYRCECGLSERVPVNKEPNMTTTLVPENVLKNFRRYAKAKGAAGLPQEWLVQFVEHGLMYWQDESRADYTGLGEEMLDDDRRDRGIWEPLAIA